MRFRRARLPVRAAKLFSAGQSVSLSLPGDRARAVGRGCVDGSGLGATDANTPRASGRITTTPETPAGPLRDRGYRGSHGALVMAAVYGRSSVSSKRAGIGLPGSVARIRGPAWPELGPGGSVTVGRSRSRHLRFQRRSLSRNGRLEYFCRRSAVAASGSQPPDCRQPTGKPVSYGRPLVAGRFRPGGRLCRPGAEAPPRLSRRQGAPARRRRVQLRCAR